MKYLIAILGLSLLSGCADDLKQLKKNVNVQDEIAKCPGLCKATSNDTFKIFIKSVRDKSESGGGKDKDNRKIDYDYFYVTSDFLPIKDEDGNPIENKFFRYEIFPLSPAHLARVDQTCETRQGRCKRRKVNKYIFYYSRYEQIERDVYQWKSSSKFMETFTHTGPVFHLNQMGNMTVDTYNDDTIGMQILIDKEFAEKHELPEVEANVAYKEHEDIPKPILKYLN